MTEINVHEAKAHLSRYLKRVENGETVTICRRNKPIAEIRAIVSAPPKRRRRIGIYKGKWKVPKSFFDPLPAGADLYLLKKVLNNWPDREALAILNRCAEAARAAAARPAGRVVVLGSVSPDDAPRQLVMEMVLLGGKQRTISEFWALARAAGLEVSAAGQQPSGAFVVECGPT